MEDTEKSKIPLKIFTNDRRIRKGVLASSYADLVIQCKEKFTIEEGRSITIVINEDGVEIDDDFFSTLTPNTVLMILQEGEMWNKQFESSCKDTSTTGMEVSTSKIMDFIEQARASKRKCSELPGRSAQKLPKPETVKLGIGWQHYSYNTAGYHQVRSSRNKQIPSHDIILTNDEDYDGTVKILQDIFFKKGRNYKGRLSEMESRIGNSAGREISRDGFTAKKYYDTCQTQKKRIYLLTKTKAKHITSLDFSISSDSDESLPDLGNILSEGAADNSSQQNTSNSQLTAPIMSHNLAAVSTLNSPSSSQFTANVIACTLPAVSTQTCSTPSASQFTSHLSSSSFPAVSTPISQTSSPSNILVHAGTPTVTMQVPNTVRKCVICADREIDAVIQPCFHSLCLVCGLHMEEHGKKCPICRGTIESVRSIFYC